jgi:integrase
MCRRPKGSGGNKANAWLWPEQAEAIFAEAEKLDTEFAALLIVLCYTGMRLGEALGLTWNDVRLQDGFAYVPDTKNGEPRAVFLPPVAVAALGNLDRREGRRRSDSPRAVISIHFSRQRPLRPGWTFRPDPPFTSLGTAMPPGCADTPASTPRV